MRDSILGRQQQNAIAYVQGNAVCIEIAEGNVLVCQPPLVAIGGHGFELIALQALQLPGLEGLGLQVGIALVTQYEVYQPPGLKSVGHAFDAIGKEQARQWMAVPLAGAGVLAELVVCVFHKLLLKEKREKKKAAIQRSGTVFQTVMMG